MNNSIRTIAISGFSLAVLGTISSAAYAAVEGKEAIRLKLAARYQLTKVTDDKSAIVTQGSQVVLQKDKLLMLDATSAANPCANTYRKGKIVQSTACSVGGRIIRGPLKSYVPRSDSAPRTRVFVTGEKFWVTKIEIQDASNERGIFFDFFTDAIEDVHYKAHLVIPFEAATPSPDEALTLVAEVITVAPSEDAKDSQPDEPQPAPPAAASEPAEAALTPITPPPPPPPDPVAVSEGQTIDQVVKAWGPPLTTAKAGNKVIYSYRDVKVIFVDGVVKDVE
jgi:hypothetical protein